MADNEQAEGADGAEAASSKKGKLKLIIAAAGFVAILGAGAGWFFLMRGHGEEKHAEAPPPRMTANPAAAMISFSLPFFDDGASAPSAPSACSLSAIAPPASIPKNERGCHQPG